MTQAEADAWAKGSQYADDVFYHGTTKIDEIMQNGFNLEKLGTNTKNGGLFGAGHYTTPSYQEAVRYTGGGGKVLKLKVNVKSVLNSWDEMAKLNDISDNAVKCIQGIKELQATGGLTQELSLQETIKMLESRELKTGSPNLLSKLTSKEWETLNEICNTEKFAFEWSRKSIIESAGYDAIQMPGVTETVILNDKYITVIQ